MKLSDSHRGLRANPLWVPGDILGFLAHLGCLVMGETDPLAPLALQGLVDLQAMVLVRGLKFVSAMTPHVVLHGVPSCHSHVVVIL